MIRVIAETRTVYRSEVGCRRGRLTKRAAYLDAARAAWRARYPETYEAPEYDDFGRTIDPGGLDDWIDPIYRQRVLARLMRWLMWRDARAGTTKRDAVVELTELLRAAGLTPYLHAEGCAMWRREPCDMGCGPHSGRAHRKESGE